MGGYRNRLDPLARCDDRQRQYCWRRRRRHSRRPRICRRRGCTCPVFMLAGWIPTNRKKYMKYKRALITGGAGLIGSHIVDLLVAEGLDEVVVLDNFTRGRRENLESAIATGNVTIVEGDIRDVKLLSDVMEGIDIVFHEAAIRITECAEKPRLALEVLADGTFNVMEAAVAADVKKVITASSASVYGLAEEF